MVLMLATRKQCALQTAKLLKLDFLCICVLWFYPGLPLSSLNRPPSSSWVILAPAQAKTILGPKRSPLRSSSCGLSSQCVHSLAFLSFASCRCSHSLEGIQYLWDCCHPTNLISAGVFRGSRGEDGVTAVQAGTVQAQIWFWGRKKA